jgi:hypothetical protein
LVRPLSLASGLKLGTKEYEEDRQTAWRWVGLGGSRGRDVVSLAFRPFLRQNAFFALPNAFAVVLLEENAAWRARLGDYSTALEYETSHVLRRICNGEDKPIFLRHPFYEESARY